ncbi:MAG: HAD-IC family P-type ATPase [Planctomycetaceae bacterium]|nr:HAD-IC family P-type ATPase [Planctomycetaceae bacterium]
MRKKLQDIHWETLAVEAALQTLDTGKNGLSHEDAAERLALYGKNKLPEAEKEGPIKRFFKHFHNALIYVLLGAAVITSLMAAFYKPEYWIDTFVILGVVVINSIIGFVQEGKAQKALDSIKNLLSLKASVIRDGKRKGILAELLVPGDIVFIMAGDKMPADLRLLNVNRLEVDEASLTGESLAVSKTTKPVEPETGLGDRVSMVYAGTTVRTGDAIGVVTATGVDTEVGKINTMLTGTEGTSTPLMIKIDGFGQILTIIILFASAVLAIYAIAVSGIAWAETIIAVIGLAVSAIPEGLPAIITITLALGMQRLAGKKAIIRRLPSVETLGSVTVICSDKTGTLTKNEMTATNVYTRGGDFIVSGNGYIPEGEIGLSCCYTPEGKVKLDCCAPTDYNDSVLQRLIQSAFLCNSSDVAWEKNVWIPIGAPTEAALKVLARKAGYDGEDATVINEIPFDSEFKYRVSLVEVEGKRFIFVNGAPEKLKQVCGSQLTATGTEPMNIPFWEGKIEEAASHGQRLIGCAYREVSGDKTTVDHADLNEGMIFAGITGIIDPPKVDAIEAVRVCRAAGIRVKMITGDHVLTAKEIAMQMGLTDRPKVICGRELEEMNDEQMRQAVASCDIFARTSPEHKLKLVKALQELGEVVAMTGDGVNDAPALKKADIGVAMGIKGTEVTKDAAAMVLTDDNFASIVTAVEEGRTIYDNIRKTLLFIFPTNGAQASVIILFLLVPWIFLFEMPITAVQILWVNMVTAVTLSISLAFERAERHVMERPPRNPKEPLICGYFIFRIGYVSCIVTILTIFHFYLCQNRPEAVLAYSQAATVNMIVFSQLFYLFTCRRMHQTIFGQGFLRSFFTNRVVFISCGILILIQLGYTYLPFMNHLFRSAGLSLMDWLIVIAGGALLFAIVEIEKVVSAKVLENWHCGW